MHKEGLCAYIGPMYIKKVYVHKRTFLLKGPMCIREPRCIKRVYAHKEDLCAQRGHYVLCGPMCIKKVYVLKEGLRA